MIALVMFSGRVDIMGRFASRGATHAAAVGATIVVAMLNAFLVLQTLGVPLAA
jgi:Mn2+/Fe2+ NRAMP family transporter